jgi:hypothetical protein
VDAAGLELQRRPAGLSTRGVHQVATNSGHTIDATESELVVAAIRRMVEDVRGGCSDHERREKTRKARKGGREGVGR